MPNRSTSRTYGVSIGGVEITQYDLQVLKSQANTILRDTQGFDASRAWTTAVLNLLVSRGILNATENLKADEKPS